MSSKLNRWALAALLVLTAVAAACSGGQDEAAQAEAEAQAALEEIQQHKQDLDALRAQIAAAEQAEAAAAAEEDGEEAAAGEEGAETAAAEESGPSPAQLRSDFEEKFGELHGAIGRYFQEVDPLIEGETPNDRQMAVLRINSDEAMINAQEYIREGGDYRGAINALNAALATDPENAELQATLAETEAMRYMSEERFSVVENGMTQAEVRAQIGIPHHANRRNFEEEGVEAWYYPVDPEGSAAAVYFQKKGDDLVVYKFNFREVVKEEGDEADA